MLKRPFSAAEKMSENRETSSDRPILPIEIVLFQGYLSIEDISHLDIAICNVNLRLELLNSLKFVKIRDHTFLGRGDNFVPWIIRYNLKLLNFKGNHRTFTKISAYKMAAGR